MNIVVLGHVDVDHNKSENSSYITAGSPAVFINKIFQQLPDARVSIIAQYGKDFFDYKKNLPLLKLKSELPLTLIYENVSKNNNRIQKALNREYALPPELTFKMEDSLRNADTLFFAPILPNFDVKYLEKVTSLLKQECLKIILPQGYGRDFDNENNVVLREFKEEEIISLFDIVIVSEQDGENMLDKAKAWVEKYGVLVIVTTGKDGAVAVTKERKINLPTNTVDKKDIVDTVGSGDIFSAAFAYKYYLTHNIEESGKFANEIARQSLFFTPDNIKIDPSKI